MSENTVPPVSLANLFRDLDYLAGIGDSQKYCFVHRTYINNGLFSSIYRAFYAESQDTNGISIMENICIDATQQYERYKNNKTFGKPLLDRIVRARHGLNRCKNTYTSLQKGTTASNIEIRILTLDNIIPEQRKIDEGIIHKKEEDEEKKIDNEDKEEVKEEINATPNPQG